ncbi:MAG: hypothetical protein IH987_05225 [Planctomycetes bacterium]|nr:hypothetical protein [Planctomycetota bacterium]
MPRSDDHMHGYSRGYNAGSRGSWPDHRPPAPPNELVALAMAAARELRDEADVQIATFCEDDPMTLAIGAKIDEFDRQMQKIGAWLLEPAVPPA